MDEKLIAPELPVQKDPLSTDYEKGWHKVFSCEDLEVNKAISIDDFATQIVVWRGADGIVRALDLFCKHMGASLACGEVDGNGIRCHFMPGDGMMKVIVMILDTLIRFHQRPKQEVGK